MKSLRYLIYAFVVALLVSCGTDNGKRYKESKFLMGTIVEITAVGNESDCQQAVKLAFDEIKEFVAA